MMYNSAIQFCKNTEIYTEKETGIITKMEDNKMKKFFSEFKEFAMRGNVIDMAVGIVVGGAFKGIVDSLVNDIITPIVGIVANKDLSNHVFMIGDVAIKYGSFLSAVINFILMAFVIFIMIKFINKIKRLGKKEEAETATTTKVCPYCKNEVPIEATRCGHCTSVLEVNEEQESQEENS
jgi:large conductance mechanosensitive channel